jgi:hypothetical protein
MPQTFNVHCDESCHLENDGIKVMALGAVWWPSDKAREIDKKILCNLLREGSCAHRCNVCVRSQ